MDPRTDDEAAARLHAGGGSRDPRTGQTGSRGPWRKVAGGGPHRAARSGTGSLWGLRELLRTRAAGAAPVYRGDPAYGSHLDRDDDGVGCE